jgi:hypothetical protein
MPVNRHKFRERHASLMMHPVFISIGVSTSRREARTATIKQIGESQKPAAAPPKPPARSRASPPTSAPSAAARRGSPRPCPAPGSEREEPADVGDRDPLMLCEIGDRLCLTTLDPPPPTVRPDKRLDQRLVSTRLPCRCRHALRRHDQLLTAPALQAHRDARTPCSDIQLLQPIEQCLCFLQVGCVKTLREQAVD